MNLISVPGKAEQSRSSFHISEMILIFDSHTVCVLGRLR